MKKDSDSILTTKQHDSVRDAFGAVGKAGEALFATIQRVSEEHEVFKGFVAKGKGKNIECKREETFGIGSSPWAIGKPRVDGVREVKGTDGAETIVENDEYAPMTRSVVTVTKDSPKYNELVALRDELVAAAVDGGASRKHALKTISGPDGAWRCLGVSLVMRKLNDDDARTKAGIEKLPKADQDAATEAFNLIAEHVGDRPWADVAKIARALAKEAEAREAAEA